MKLFLACLLCTLLLTTGCALLTRPKGKWQIDRDRGQAIEKGGIVSESAAPDSTSSAEVQQEQKEPKAPVHTWRRQPKGQWQIDHERKQAVKKGGAEAHQQVGPRFGISLGMMACYLRLHPSVIGTSKADYDEEFEHEMQSMSNAAMCPRLDVAYTFPRVNRTVYTLKLYGFEQEYDGDAVLDQDILFQAVTFLRWQYVKSRARIGCLGAICRLSWERLPRSARSGEPLPQKPESVKLTPYVDFGLQYFTFSMRLSSDGISAADSTDLTRGFLGGGLELTFCGRASVFAEGAIITVFPPFFDGFHISGGLSCNLAENLEVSAAYLRQQYYIIKGHNNWHDPGFEGLTFALTFRF